ncbi:MAG TPA: ABC transporter substrate-binding protein, partial [Firmicutes bacterium]|nr:ABC transporter substrate-binding protein [Bacillota bacterium]
MRGRGTRTAVVALLLVGSVLMGTLVAGLGGCRPAPVTSGPVPDGQQIAMALIPIEDTLPFWVADQKGYFREEGVKVTLKTFASATERDAALTAGEVDGAVADLVATALLCAGGTRVTITSLTLGAEGREGRIAVLSPPGSPLKKVEDLRGAEIAVSPNSLIEYTVSRLLEKHGVAPTEVKMVSVPKIPVRFELLMAGKLAAAGLPDPFAALAQKKGAQLIVDDV